MANYHRLTHQETTGNFLMLQISAIPACIGNYIWIFHSDDKRGVWILDPGDAGLVKQWLSKNDKELAGILITHHHWDHVDGIEDLLTPDLPVVGPAKETFKHTNIPLNEGDTIDICLLYTSPSPRDS